MSEKSLANDARKKALDAALSVIRKTHGDGAVIRLGNTSHMQVEVIPTGILSLDIALGVGGVPRGRITEIYGPEGSGKTTICLHIVAQAQKTGGVAAYLDMEHALDPAYAARCGVCVNDLLVSQPDTAEQCFDIAENLIHSNAVDVIVIDSVAALLPRAEIEGEIGDVQPGLQARLMSRVLRRLSGALKHSNAALIFTNQLRQNIGVMFGNPETTTGGLALKFYASIRLEVRRVSVIKSNGQVAGSVTRIRVTKNKVAPPFRECQFDLYYHQGACPWSNLLDVAVGLGVLERRGAFYLFEGQRIGCGREQSAHFLRDHPEIAQRVEGAVRALVASGKMPPPGAAFHAHQQEQARQDAHQDSAGEEVYSL